MIYDLSIWRMFYLTWQSYRKVYVGTLKITINILMIIYWIVILKFEIFE